MPRVKKMITTVRDPKISISLDSILEKLSANLRLRKERTNNSLELQGHDYYISLDKKGRELSYVDRVSSFTFRSEGSKRPIVLTYQLKARYLSGRRDLLKDSGIELCKRLAEEYKGLDAAGCLNLASHANDPFLEGIMKIIKIPDLKQVYPFISIHISE